MDYLKEIIYDLEDRMRNIGDFYAIYKIINSSGKFKEKYNIPTLCMGILSFLVYENNFKFNSNVTTENIMNFIEQYAKEFLKENIEEIELIELTDFVISKLTNKGYKFEYEFFSTRDKAYKRKSIRLVDVKVNDENKKFKYSVSEQGLEFYLKTKEYNEEYKIEIMQIIFKKLLEKNAFEDALHALRRLNTEIVKLIEKRNSVISLLSDNLKEGLEQYSIFIKRMEGQCEQESQMFGSIKRVLDKAIERYYLGEYGRSDSREEKTSIKDEENIRTLKNIEVELKLIIDRHEELIHSKIDLINKKNEILKSNAVSAFKEGFDFEIELNNLVLKDYKPDVLSVFSNPLWSPVMNKSFNPLMSISEQRLINENNAEEEVPVSRIDNEYKTIDRINSERIESNYYFYSLNLLKLIKEKREIELKDFIKFLHEEFGENVFSNSDIISYMITLTKVFKGEDIIRIKLSELRKEKYSDVVEIALKDAFMEVDLDFNNIVIERINSEFTLESILTITNFLFKGEY